ncbi:hypothetical protein [Kitasatospora sp. NBC_00315]|uniref:hypothetical protein n=1 Tax=Kitasatospora sp. NBC_00315 TaxID=2975963 RepID=UPI003254918D
MQLLSQLLSLPAIGNAADIAKDARSEGRAAIAVVAGQPPFRLYRVLGEHGRPHNRRTAEQ